MSQKYEDETTTVESFLKTLKRPPTTVEHREKPDVVVGLRGGTDPTVRYIGIEVTRHFNDEASDGGSEGHRLNRFWAGVQTKIEKLKSRSGQLLKVHAYVELKKERLKQAHLIFL